MVGRNNITLVWWHLAYSLVLVPQPSKAMEDLKDMEKTTNLLQGSEVCSSRMIQVPSIKLPQPPMAVLLASASHGTERCQAVPRSCLPGGGLREGEDVAEVEELVEEEGSATVKRHERLDRVVPVSVLGYGKGQVWAAHRCVPISSSMSSEWQLCILRCFTRALWPSASTSWMASHLG